MADQVSKIIITGDGTAAVTAFNQVAGAGKKMQQDITSGTSGIKASFERLASFASSIMPIISRLSVAGCPFLRRAFDAERVCVHPRRHTCGRRLH
jgi:hypothetical protein